MKLQVTASQSVSLCGDDRIVCPSSADVAGTLDQQTAAIPLRAIQCSDRLHGTEGRHRVKQRTWTLLTSSSIVYKHDKPPQVPGSTPRVLRCLC